jgi:nucleotide-binding universal stress UspA family protein
MTKTIAVGMDGSTGSGRAFAWALHMGRSMEADVQPVLAWSYPTLALLPYPIGLPVPTVEAMQADTEMRAEVLADSQQDADERAGPKIKILPTVVRQGSASHVLCDVAEDADLLVVGSRGLGSMSGAMLGSVGAHCIAAAPCPVVLVPDEPAGPTSGLVVVGVDGSAQAHAAVRWADTWAPLSATLLLVYTWTLPVAVDAMAATLDIEALEGSAHAIVDAAKADVTRHSVETLCMQGDARGQLAKLGKAADLVVLGANGHNAVHRFLLGSVAHHVAHHLVAPTVIVRSVN